MSEISKRDKAVLFMNIWIGGTLLLFYAGPIDYSTCNKNYSLIYMLFFLLVSNFFYYLGVRQRVIKCRKRIRWNTNKIVHLSIVFGFTITLLYFLESAYRLGFSGFHISNILQSMAQTYTDEKMYVFRISGWILSYTKAFRIIGLVLGMYYWPKLPRKEKVLVIATAAIIVIHNTAFAGSQKELIDLVVYCVVPTLLRWTQQDGGIRAHKKIILIAAGIGIVVFLGSAIAARQVLWGNMFGGGWRVDADTNNWLYKLLPSSIRDAVLYLLSYLTQGYRGLALCLELPFEWSMGMGGSFKIMNDVSRWFHIPLSVLENSYPVRMESTFGVGAYSAWHTIFPWIASDVTFFGAVFLVSLFVYYWGKSWKECLVTSSWIAPVMFTHLTIFILYIPCNNQLFQTRDSIVASIMIFIFWYLFHGESADLYISKESSKSEDLFISNELGD